MIYKIFFDSNRLFNQHPIEEPFNRSIEELVDFIKLYNVTGITICLPEIVIRERLQQKLEDIDKEINNFNKIRRTLNNLGHEIKEIAPLSTYKDTLEQKIADYVSKNNIARVKPPSISKEDLIDRAINKMRPFDDNASGFKDTLIYLSIVEDALDESNCADRYIYCTQDYKQFDDNIITEFKNITKKELYICKDVTNVKEKLDELLPLGLHLETRNQQLKNIILKHIGSIMIEVNKGKNQRISSGQGFNTDLHNITNYPEDTDWLRLNLVETNKVRQITGYNFNEINFEQFSELLGGEYAITARLNTIIKYKEEPRDTNPEWATYSIYPMREKSSWDIGRYEAKIQNFNLTIVCNLEKETIQSISFSKSLVF